jgi:hypothetical protein
MKYVVLAFTALTVLAACNSNDQAATKGYTTEDSINRVKALNSVTDTANFTSIQWLDSVHQDRGNIPEGTQLEITWRFKNTGTKPLIIAEASATCGCTVADKPEEPIAPGAEGRIRAVFDSKGKPGTQGKEVYVTANTAPATQHKLSFMVNVAK